MKVERTEKSIRSIFCALICSNKIQSKEDCAQVCAVFYAEKCSEEITQAIRSEAEPMENLMELIYSGSRIAQRNTIQGIHSAPNQVFHQMVMAQLVLLLAPVCSDIFSAGNKSGDWNIVMPLETAEMFLTKLIGIESDELERMFQIYQR